MASDSDAAVVLLGAALYLCAALSSLRITASCSAPAPSRCSRGWAPHWLPPCGVSRDGLRHLAERRAAARALAAMTLMRFCYGALTVMVLMLCRYAWADGPGDGSEGLTLLGIAVGISGAGFFTAAVLTPWGAGRFGPYGWTVMCAGTAAVLEPALALPFAPAPMMIAAFVLGLTTQGVKIATDTVVQSSVDDAFRGRIFSIYDVLFNVAFVGAAATAAMMLPADGRSAALVVAVALLYAAVAAAMFRWSRIEGAL